MVLTLVSVDKTLWCNHSNEASSTILLHTAIIWFSAFYKIKFGIFLSLTLVTFKGKRIKNFECYPLTSFVSSSILRFRCWIRIWMGVWLWLWLWLWLWIRLVGIWVWWLDRRRWLERWRGLKSASASTKIIEKLKRDLSINDIVFIACLIEYQYTVSW